MYNGIFYHQYDFEHPDGEENLIVYWSNQGPVFHEDSDLYFLMTRLGVGIEDLQVRFDEIEENNSWRITECHLGILEDWKRIVSHYLTSPLNHQPFELSFVEKGWIIREKWNGHLWVGTGNHQWIVVQWSTTA